MSRPTLSIRRVVLACTPLYTCVDCGARAEGTPLVQIEAEHVHSHDVPDILRRVPVFNSHMPVGWAGYGIDIHRCPKCAK